jgi:hypothetical protein
MNRCRWCRSTDADEAGEVCEECARDYHTFASREVGE